MKTVPRGLFAVFAVLVLILAIGGLWLFQAQEQLLRGQAYAGWRTQAQLIAGLLIGLGIALIAGFGMVWQRYVKKQYQAAYRAEAQYRAILMSAGDGVIACDSGGRVTLLNPVAETLTGWLQEEALGKPMEEVFVIVNEETRLPVDNPVARVLREGIVVGLANHTLLIKKDGSEYPVADSGAPIFDEQGRTIGAVLVFRDQTRDHRAESALQRSNQQLERAEAMADMGCWEFDFQSRTVWASPSARRIYGLSDEMWTIKAAQDLPLPEYRQTLNRALEGLVHRAEAYDVEFRICRPTDGAVIDIRSQAEYNPEEGKVFGIIQNITEQKRAEAAIRESESRYRSLFQNNHAVMLLLNPENGAVVDANPAAVAYYGWTREELLAKNIAEINMLAPRELQAAMTAVLSAQRNSFEFRHRLADGSVREVEVIAGALQLAGEERLYSIIHDITERKRAEEQKEKLQEQLLQAQKLESVGRLAGGVAHDLNNLLSPILGYGEVLLMGLPAENQHRKYVQHIIEAGTRARDLVRQLLAFGRKQTLVVETVDLNEVISVFTRLLRRTVREDIAIETVPAPALPAVRVDAGQMEQVLMNLVVNAQDAMPEGGRITIETAVAEPDPHPGAPPGRSVVLTVSDTGCGMDPEVREQIFAPFFTTKERGKGTGLGLSTAYGIVKQHGGNIWVDSVPGEGTTFSISLPAVAASPGPKPVDAANAPEKAEGCRTVMVVEDNDMVRQLTVDILTLRGYTVLEAAGGAECLRLLGEHPVPIDLLITDVVMPEMNGKMLYRQAVQLVPGLKVLYMSGYTENIIAPRGVLDRGVDFIQKPFTPNALAAKVREVLAF
jgi:PAS domain S-box-containing protein